VNLNKSLADYLNNQQVSQLLVQIKKSENPNKAPNPIKPKKHGCFCKNPGFSEAWQLQLR